MRKSKYGNIKTLYKNILFHSKKEATYAKTLDALKRAKKPEERVESYDCQRPYPIFINGKKVTTYIADFLVKYADGHVEIVDVKGYKNSIYNLKKKIVEAYYGIKITEI